MTSTQTRLTLAAAVATLLATFTLVPLLQGGGWFAAVLVVVIVVAMVGAAGRRQLRWWPVVVLLQVIALAETLTLLFARDVATWSLLPGPDALRELGDLVNAGLEVTRRQAPPVVADRGVILVACGGIGLIAVVVDMIAASLRRPAVAGLPLLAVYCVPAAVLPGGLSWWYFVVAAAGFLILVGSDSIDRIQGWGRVLGPAGSDRARAERALGGPLAGARRLALGCVLVAAAAPALVPGLNDQLLGDSGSGHGAGHGGPIKVVNPILTLRENLTTRDGAVVLRYTSSATAPEPLRIVSDDVFDGEKWYPSTGEIPRDNKVQDGLPAAPGLSSAVPTHALRTRISVLGLAQTYLPLPYPATKVDINGPWIYNAQDLNVVGDGVTTLNTTYTVEHLAVEPTPDQLEGASSPPAAVVKTYGQLPASLPTVIHDTAQRITAKGATPYEKALALQDWLRSSGGFTYSLTVTDNERTASGQDAVAAFLRDKRGYCVQFASTMAVMARSLGIPSRVAVGFLPGRQRQDGTWEITLKDAHAWPELYFTGVGWVRFEPTPSARAPEQPAWAQGRAVQTPTVTATVTQSAGASATQAPHRRDNGQDALPTAPKKPLLQRVLAAVPWRWLAALGVVLLLGGVPLAVERVVRRVRWRRAEAGSPVARVEAAWEELRERLEDLGVSWASSWTPRALQLRLVSDHSPPGSAQAALGRLVADLEHARYAAPDDVARGSGEMRADVGAVVQAVAASPKVSTWMRRRARFLPASGLRTLRSALRRVDVAADRAGQRMSELGVDVRRRVSRR